MGSTQEYYLFKLSCEMNPRGGIAMSSPFVGAWEVVSDVSEGFWVFTETHYSLATMQKNRKRFQGSEPTQEEAAVLPPVVN